MNTGVLPTALGAYAASPSLTLSSTTVQGSFAAVAESARLGTSYNFFLGSTSGTATQQWNLFDTNVAEFGGGNVSGLAGGSTTITETASGVTWNAKRDGGRRLPTSGPDDLDRHDEQFLGREHS